MRRNTSASTVAWAVDLAESEHEAFARIYPVKGSFTSVITLGLQCFLDMLEREPQLQVWAHEDIARHLHLEDKPEKRRTLEINIPTALYERFNQLIPEFGGTSWFVRRLIASTIAGDTTPLQEQVTKAVERLLSPFSLQS